MASVINASLDRASQAINDIVNEFRINYSAKNIGLTLGPNYRWRECCPNAAQIGSETTNKPAGMYVRACKTYAYAAKVRLVRSLVA